MNERTLNAKGKGEIVYDYDNDLLLFKVKERDYDLSYELHNFVIDVDTEQFVTGIRIFDASKFFDLPKIALRDIPEWSFKARVESGIITVELKFVTRMRNRLKQIKERPVMQRITERINEKLPDAMVTVTA